MRHSLNLKQTALIAALASAYPLQVLANAGVTQFSIGDVTVQRATANTPLTSGTRIESGDLITTGNTGRTQLRFTDGGMVSLQPNSQFKISRYSDAGNAQQDSFLVDLARGGMRALTGLIGKRNRENYKVTTSTATIGIRGSGFSMAYNGDGTLGVTTEQDAIEVCTQAGCIGLNLGESALVTNANALPTRTNQRALWNPPNPRRLIGARNDDVDSEGKTVTIPRQVFAGLAYIGAGLRSEEEADIRGYLEGATLVEGGVIKGYRARNNDQGDSGTVTILTPPSDRGSIEAGNFMLLGTWVNSNWSGSNPTNLQQSAFVIGQPTPLTALASAAGLRGQYNLTAGSPVYSGGGTGTLLPSSNLTVDFRDAFGHVDMNLYISLPPIANEYEASAASIILGGSSDGLYTLRGSATATRGGFSGSLGITSSSTNYTVGTGSATGFFGGPQASNLGLTFTGNTLQHGALAGAGIFTRAGGGGIPETTVSNDPLELQVLDGSGYFYVDQYSRNNSINSGEGSATFSGTQLRQWTGCSSCDSIVQTDPNAGPVRIYGSVGQPTDSHFLGWGSWAKGEFSDYYDTTALTDVHYVVGKPTSYMPYMGTATYALIGGTVPTSTLGGNGLLLSSSNMSVDFGNQTLTANINLQFGSTLTGFSQSGIISGSNFRSIGCGNNFFSGFFSGDNAARAGMVYGINNHSTLGNIRGAAAFQQISITIPQPN